MDVRSFVDTWRCEAWRDAGWTFYRMAWTRAYATSAPTSTRFSYVNVRLCIHAQSHFVLLQGKRSPLKREIFVPTSPKRVAIHENTPLAPRRLENGRTVSQVALLRSQLASLARGKHTTGDSLQQVTASLLSKGYFKGPKALGGLAAVYGLYKVNMLPWHSAHGRYSLIDCVLMIV